MKDVIYIFHSYLFRFYFIPLNSMTADHNHGCNKKYSFCLFYYVQIHISQNFIFWTKIQSYHLTLLVRRTRIIFCFFSHVEIVLLIIVKEVIGICLNNIQPVFPWLSRFTNELKYYLLFQITNLGSGFAASLQYM